MTMLDGPRRTARPLVAASRTPPAPPPRRTTTSAGRAIATVFLALLLATFLCADTLVRIAERQPFGTTRDVALAISEPIQSVSHAVGLHLPRQWLAELTDGDALPTSAAGADLDVPSATVPPVDRADPPDRPRPPGDAATGTTQPPVTTTTTLPPRRTPTAEAPLRIAMFGDSLMGQISMALGRLVRDDPRIHVDADYHVSTGLARPDVLDWPAYLAQQLEALNPEVVYLNFGGNDDQDMQLADGTRVSIHTSEWRAEYSRRVALTMDVAAQHDRTVVWIGLPAERPERLHLMKDVMSEVAREQASIRPRVRYIDLVSLLTPGGQYRDDFVFPDGSSVRVRERDGVHLSTSGGDIVAPVLLEAIATEWNLVPPAAPPAPAAPNTTTTQPAGPPPTTATTAARAVS
jgi:hypothetical protein